MHGHNNVLNAVIFPHNIGLGCTRNPKLIEQVHRVTAEEIRATGIQWAFGPCVTVPQDIRWGRTYEGFSEDPKLVRELAGPAVRGFQGGGLDDPLGVLACAKHYVGDGGTTFGSAKTGLDQGDTRVDEATLRRIHLPGYIAAIEAGVGTIMPSYSSWNGVKCSASKRLLTDILKNELGFQGFLISDYNAIDQLAKDYKEAVGISINAGMDMVMVPTRYREYFNDLKALVNEGKVPMSRIDDAVLRILRVKFAMGLMDPKRNQLADRELQKSFGSPEHRAVARQAVRESLVLLKNEGKTLPLSKKAAAPAHRRQERRRYRQPVRRLDHRLAGQERRRHHRRHHHPRRHQEHRLQGHQGDLLQGRLRRGGRHRRRGRDRRDALRGNEGRPRRSRAGAGRYRGREDDESGGHPGGGGPGVRASHDSGRRPRSGQRRGGRLAAGHRRPGRGRRALRRLQTDRQALLHLAASRRARAPPIRCSLTATA